MGGHWYAQDGTPVHWQPDGKDTTLRHARKQGLVPGFSGVTSVLAKPGLDVWKENQILEAAFNMPVPIPEREDGDQYPAWKSEVKKLAAERGNKARNRGLEIHNAIEEYIKLGPHPDFPIEWEKYITVVEAEIKDAFTLSLRDLEAETTFACGLGYGGMIDGLARPTTVTGGFSGRTNGILLDWKTKDTEFGDKTRLAYDDHGMQLAAYRYGIGIESAICANVFISPSANVRIHVWDESELVRLFDKFKACLTLWQIDRKYNSAFREINHDH